MRPLPRSGSGREDAGQKLAARPLSGGGPQPRCVGERLNCSTISAPCCACSAQTSEPRAPCPTSPSDEVALLRACEPKSVDEAASQTLGSVNATGAEHDAEIARHINRVLSVRSSCSCTCSALTNEPWRAWLRAR